MIGPGQFMACISRGQVVPAEKNLFFVDFANGVYDQGPDDLAVYLYGDATYYESDGVLGVGSSGGGNFQPELRANNNSFQVWNYPIGFEIDMIRTAPAGLGWCRAVAWGQNATNNSWQIFFTDLVVNSVATGGIADIYLSKSLGGVPFIRAQGVDIPEGERFKLKFVALDSARWRMYLNDVLVASVDDFAGEPGHVPVHMRVGRDPSITAEFPGSRLIGVINSFRTFRPA